jgi:hypothetical protein
MAELNAEYASNSNCVNISSPAAAVHSPVADVVLGARPCAGCEIPLLSTSIEMPVLEALRVRVNEIVVDNQ